MLVHTQGKLHISVNIVMRFSLQVVVVVSMSSRNILTFSQEKSTIANTAPNRFQLQVHCQLIFEDITGKVYGANIVRLLLGQK